MKKNFTPLEFSFYLGTKKYRNPYPLLILYGLSKDYLYPSPSPGGGMEIHRSGLELDEGEPDYFVTYINGLFPDGASSSPFSSEGKPGNYDAVIKAVKHDLSVAANNRDKDQIKDVVELARTLKGSSREDLRGMVQAEPDYLFRHFPYAYAFDMEDTFFPIFDDLRPELPEALEVLSPGGKPSVKLKALIDEVNSFASPPKRFPWSR